MAVSGRGIVPVSGYGFVAMSGCGIVTASGRDSEWVWCCSMTVSSKLTGNACKYYLCVCVCV